MWDERLSEKLTALAETLTDAERVHYKLLLGMAAGGLVRDGGRPHEGPDALAFNASVTTLSRLQPHYHLIPPSGVVYRGRPEFATGELVESLRRESASLRHTAFRHDDHFVVSNAPLAREMSYSTALDELVGSHAGHVTPTARANYLYYDQPGNGIDPHIDTEAFSLNAIMMLEHVHVGEPSALVLYPPSSEPERILLEPGELIVFFADSITHARERMRPGERVSIVGFGFQPLT